MAEIVRRLQRGWTFESTDGTRRFLWEGQRKLSKRTVRLVMDFHNSLWALTHLLRGEVDRTRRQTIAILSGPRRSPAEPPEGFAKRSARLPDQDTVRMALWSHGCTERVL